MSEDAVQVRSHGEAGKPVLVYLPGLHGDWTLVSSFRAAVQDQVQFVEVAYPRTTNWSLAEYAAGVADALMASQINDGWVLAESFGSQIAWAILDRTPPTFQMQGLILAGGFVRHPAMSAVHLTRAVNRAVPMRLLHMACGAYARYARFRHRRAPETLSSISEFVRNRVNEVDRQAICHRYTIIAGNDLRTIARQTRLPVFQLCGFFDPIVPWPLVQPWLRKNCPGFRHWKVILGADHNVLGTAPKASAKCILRWMASTP